MAGLLVAVGLNARLHLLRSPLESAEASGHVEQVSSDAPVDEAGSELAQVSRAMSRIYKEQFGRGPDRVRTYYAGPDAITSFLEGTLTPVERTLSTMDEHQRLRDIRMLFQHAAEDQFRAAVEQITGRTVVAFSSGIDTRADVATESFLLKTAADG